MFDINFHFLNDTFIGRYLEGVNSSWCCLDCFAFDTLTNDLNNSNIFSIS